VPTDHLVSSDAHQLAPHAAWAGRATQKLVAALHRQEIETEPTGDDIALFGVDGSTNNHGEKKGGDAIL
jgi:hypothetical protein